jgi:hypothetical protein
MGEIRRLHMYYHNDLTTWQNVVKSPKSAKNAYMLSLLHVM